MEHEFIKQYDIMIKKVYDYTEILGVAIAYLESIKENPSKAESYATTALNTINSKLEATHLKTK